MRRSIKTGAKPLLRALCLLTALLLPAGCTRVELPVEDGPSRETEQPIDSTGGTGLIVDAPMVELFAEDTDASYAKDAPQIVCDGDAIRCDAGTVSVDGSVATIGAAGTYVVSGQLDNGQIRIDAGKQDVVRLVLAGATLHNQNGAVINAQSAGKLIVILAEGTQNNLSDTAEYLFATGEDEPNATLYSKCDLSLTGSGALRIEASYLHGIVGKDALLITDGEYNISSVGNAIRGRDSVSITGGDFTLDAQNDGIQSNNDTAADAGWVTITGGRFTINAVHDGIQAETALAISGGTFVITTGGGSAAVSFGTDGGWANPFEGGGFGGFGGGRGEWPEGETPALPEDGMPAIPGGRPGGQEGENPFGGQTPPEGMLPPNNGSGAAVADPVQAQDGSGEADSTDTTETGSDSYKGLKAGTLLTVAGGAFTIDSADDALHANGDIFITEGTLIISCGDDGVHADNELHVTGGTIDIAKCYEGLEAARVYIEGGVIDIVAADDGVNAAGGSDGGLGGWFGADSFTAGGDYAICVTGGTLSIDAGGDGMDSNGALTISGGLITISGATNSADSALDVDGVCTVNGGTVIAAGNAAMVVLPDSASEQAVVYFGLSGNVEADALIELHDASGAVLASYTAPKSFGCVLISLPELSLGESYALVVDGTPMLEGELTQTVTTVGTQPGGFGGGFGGRR